LSALDVEWLGQVPYAEGIALQQRAVDARRRGATPDRLLLLEHPPVVTLGSSAHDENLLVPESDLAARGIDVHRVRRGGDVTFHAPGQLVGYLVMDLAARAGRDVHAFLRAMEAALIDALAGLGVRAARVSGKTGVFVAPEPQPLPGAPERKLASIGIGVKHWITYHGFALNVSLDLAGFDVIVPCGLSGVEMTSVARELSAADEALGALAGDTRRAVAESFERTFDVWPRVRDANPVG
jgi:lipoyl(octanoyl) transferase